MPSRSFYKTSSALDDAQLSLNLPSDLAIFLVRVHPN